MSNYLLVNEILSKIEFKIEPNKNIRKEYLYRIKKNFYKLISHEKKFVDSITVFKDIEESDFNTIEKLSTIDTMSKISIGFLINQICKNLSSEKVYLNIGVWKGFSMFSGMLNTSCEVYGVDNFSFDYEDGNSSLNNVIEESKARKYFFEHFNNLKKENKHFFYDIDYRKFFEQWDKKNAYLHVLNYQNVQKNIF